MAVQLNASGEYLSRTGPGSQASWTIAGWFRVDTDTNDGVWLAGHMIGDFSFSSGSGLTCDTDGLTSYLTDVTGTQSEGAIPFAVARWEFRAATRSAANGAAFHASTIPGSLLTVNDPTKDAGAIGASDLFLLGSVLGVANQFLGSAAYVRVWTAELTPAELRAEMVSTSAVRTSGLWADWPLASNANDASGAGRHLTATGSVGYVTSPSIAATSWTFDDDLDDVDGEGSANWVVNRWRSMSGESAGTGGGLHINHIDDLAGDDGVLPPDDVVYDSGELWVGAGAQNYGDTDLLGAIPIDLSSLPVIVEADTRLPLENYLVGWHQIVLTNKPHPAPSSEGDNSNGATAEYGVAIKLTKQRYIAGSNFFSGAELTIWDDHAETVQSPDYAGLAYDHAVLHRVRLVIDDTAISAFLDGVPWWSDTWTLPAELQGPAWLHIGTHNHASVKYTPFPAGWSSRWAGVRHNAPLLEAPTVHRVADVFTSHTVSGSPPPGAPDGGVGAGVDTGWWTPATGLEVDDVPASVDAAILVFNGTVSILNDPGDFTVAVAFNSGTPIPVTVDTYDQDSGQWVAIVDVDPEELISGTNEIDITVTTSEGGTAPFVGNVTMFVWAGEFEEHSTTGTIALTLAASGGAAKTAGAAGSIALGLTIGDDVAKAGQAAGTADVALTIDGAVAKAGQTAGTTALALGLDGDASKTATTAGAAVLALLLDGDTAKAGETAGGIALGIDVAGAAFKIADTLGTLALELGLTGTGSTEETRSTTGTIGLALLLDAAVAKDADTAGALALALELAGDTTKLAATAGTLGLTLDLAGTVTALGEDSTLGTLALALGIVGVASKTAQATGPLAVALALAGTTEKTAATTGSIGLSLGISGTTGAIPDRSTAGAIGVALGLAGQASKTASTVGSLALVLTLVGLVGERSPVITGPLTLIDLTVARTLADLTEARTIAEVNA